jgi:hypothetical protein
VPSSETIFFREQTSMHIAQFREHLANKRALKPALPASADDEVFITYDQLPEHGVPRYSRVHMRRLMAEGLFPRSMMLSPNRIAWRKSDVAAWKASRPIAPLPVAA